MQDSTPRILFMKKESKWLKRRNMQFDILMRSTLLYYDLYAPPPPPPTLSRMGRHCFCHGRPSVCPSENRVRFLT